MSVRTASGGKADWGAGTSPGTNLVNIPEVRSWRLSVSKNAKEYASSSTGGGKQRIGGAEDFSGSLTLYIDRTSGTNQTSFDTDLGIKGGEFGTFKLYEEDGAGAFFLAPSYVESVDYEVDIEGDNVIGATVNFSRSGALSYPTT